MLWFWLYAFYPRDFDARPYSDLWTIFECFVGALYLIELPLIWFDKDVLHCTRPLTVHIFKFRPHVKVSIHNHTRFTCFRNFNFIFGTSMRGPTWSCGLSSNTLLAPFFLSSCHLFCLIKTCYVALDHWSFTFLSAGPTSKFRFATIRDSRISAALILSSGLRCAALLGFADYLRILCWPLYLIKLPFIWFDKDGLHCARPLIVHIFKFRPTRQSFDSRHTRFPPLYNSQFPKSISKEGL